TARGVQAHHIERCSRSDAQSLSLTDGEMNDALMRSNDAAVKVDNIAGLHRVRPQAPDDVGVAPGRHEADVLAIVLFRDVKTKAPRQLARLRLGHVAQRKAQVVELVAGGR